MRKKQGHWYLLTGILIGFLAGLVIAWIIQPVEYTDTSPASLQLTYKDRYRVLIAAAYAASGDLVRAKARLELLGNRGSPASADGTGTAHSGRREFARRSARFELAGFGDGTGSSGSTRSDHTVSNSTRGACFTHTSRRCG